MQELISAYGSRFLVAALGVSLALLCLFIVLWILRNRAPSPFVRGGRNRQPRLQVLDAAAVDTRRRIVLIRRDNVEHLVMIGGPTDIVIESGIGDERAYLSAQAVVPQALEGQSGAQTQASAVALPAQEISAPVNALPKAADLQPIEAPVTRRLPAEAPRQAPSAKPQEAASPVVDQKRSEPVPARSIEPVADRSSTMAAPAAAITMAATTPRASTQPQMSTQTTAPVMTEAAASETMSRPVPPVETPSTPDRPAFASMARLEPEMAAKAEMRPATDDTGSSRAEQKPLPQPAEVEPERTAGTLPIEALRVETVEPVRIDGGVSHARQIAGTDASSTNDAVLSQTIATPAVEDVLDAARMRVLTPAPTATPFDQRSFEPQMSASPIDVRAPATEAEAPARDMSDFERVLEEEMALHLASDPAPALRPAPTPEFTQILPETRADRPRPPLTAMSEGNRTPSAATNVQQPPAPEPNLQTEIARIFGEMSASRNS